jgi:hypothetical protein
MGIERLTHVNTQGGRRHLSRAGDRIIICIHGVRKIQRVRPTRSSMVALSVSFMRHNEGKCKCTLNEAINNIS